MLTLVADYIVYIMQGAGLGSPLLTASIQYIINVALTLPAILFLDKWGRRWPLLIGALGMMTWLFISGGLQQSYGQENTDETRTNANQDVTWIVYEQEPVSIAIVACSYLFVATFATASLDDVISSLPRLLTVRCRPGAPSRGHIPPRSSPPRSVPRPCLLPRRPTGASTPSWPSPCRLCCGTSTTTCTTSLDASTALRSSSSSSSAPRQRYVDPSSAPCEESLANDDPQGFTLEEMDDVFDSGVPAWRTHVKKSRLDELEHEIATGHVKVGTTGEDEVAPSVTNEKPVAAPGTHEENGTKV